MSWYIVKASHALEFLKGSQFHSATFIHHFFLNQAPISGSTLEYTYINPNSFFKYLSQLVLNIHTVGPHPLFQGGYILSTPEDTWNPICSTESYIYWGFFLYIHTYLSYSLIYKFGTARG